MKKVKILKSKYNWSHPQIPTWVKWIATDKNNSVWGYVGKPVLDLDLDSRHWLKDDCSNHQDSEMNIKPYEGGWEESLEKRPD